MRPPAAAGAGDRHGDRDSKTVDWRARPGVDSEAGRVGPSGWLSASGPASLPVRVFWHDSQSCNLMIMRGIMMFKFNFWIDS